MQATPPNDRMSTPMKAVDGEKDQTHDKWLDSRFTTHSARSAMVKGFDVDNKSVLIFFGVLGLALISAACFASFWMTSPPLAAVLLYLVI
jgi:hypothetical protein